jgi:hypothetical protein
MSRTRSPVEFATCRPNGGEDFFVASPREELVADWRAYGPTFMPGPLRLQVVPYMGQGGNYYHDVADVPGWAVEDSEEAQEWVIEAVREYLRDGH